MISLCVPETPRTCQACSGDSYLNGRKQFSCGKAFPKAQAPILVTILSVFLERVQQRRGEMPHLTVSSYRHKFNCHKRTTVYTHLTFTNVLLIPAVDCGPANSVSILQMTKLRLSKCVRCWESRSWELRPEIPQRLSPSLLPSCRSGRQEGPGTFRELRAECQLLPLASLPETGVSSPQSGRSLCGRLQSGFQTFLLL